MAHEKSITVKDGNKWVNLDTVVDGRELSPEKAVKRYRQGNADPLGGRKYKTRKEAEEAAATRSKWSGKKPVGP